MNRTTLEARIASMAAQLSGAAPDRVDPAMPFALLGLDSLATVELASSIERASGVDLPPEIVADCGNARALAAWLHRRARQNSTPVAQDPYCQMFEDARRTWHVARDRSHVARGTPHVARVDRGGLRAARKILLTGATGFLGRWIARELLDTSDATLICLVRGGPEGPEQRLARSLRIAGVGPEAIAGRVLAIDGDLTLPRLALGHAEYDKLGHSLDAICHAAAAVNWIHSYSSLRAANVLGTLELLRLASVRNAHFHFVSSISTCYSTAAPPEVDETHDALPHLRGLHLGYAQTKAVAESLVKNAAEAGVPATIYRPALISGHSRDTDFNADDLLSLLIRGCIQMGAAPDLDWTLDVLPVDEVARQILDLSSATGTFHLKHPRPRHWRDCVLWMRMYGYPLTLVPFAAWLRTLESDVDAMAARGGRHPLAPLRRFFSDRPQECGGLTLPQLYEDVRRTRALRATTERQLGDAAGRCPELDAPLLEHYFHAFRSSGQLDPPPSPIGARAGRATASANSTRNPFDRQFFSAIVEPTLGSVHGVTLLTRGSSHSIVSDLTAWQSSRPTGVFGYRLETASGRHDVILKVKPRDRDVMAVGEALARICDDRLGLAYQRWQDRVGFAQSHLREVAVYRQTDPRLARHVPRVFGSSADDDEAMWAVVLERVTGATHLDGACDRIGWNAQAVAAAIDGLARLQSVWYGREAELRNLPWCGFERTAESMAGMADLWSALAAHARPSFCAWADPTISSIHRRLIAGAGSWWRTLEAARRTLIHNDFNSRNICLRQLASGPSLCAYDWELATIGAPQRDLAELLCFVLPHDVSRSSVEDWIELHRLHLERESGFSIDRHEWTEGFRCSLYDLLVDRLSMYALIHRIRRQPFLPGVLRTWRRLYGFFPLTEDA